MTLIIYLLKSKFLLLWTGNKRGNFSSPKNCKILEWDKNFLLHHATKGVEGLKKSLTQYLSSRVFIIRKLNT